MPRFRKLAFALATAGLLTASPAGAALQYYHFVFSGAAYEASPNTAKAEGTFTLDDSVFTNPGDFVSFAEITGAMVDVKMTVTGASAGNGTFGAADFGDGYNLVIADALDLSTEWVGQAQPTSGTTWGNYKLSGSDSNDFNFFGSSPGSPIGANPFVLSADGGLGDPMVLVSITPEVTNPGELNAGDPVSNVSGATVSSFKPASIASNGLLFLRSEIKGADITSANAACLLSWDPNFSIAKTVLRAGDSIFGLPIRTFGDPVASGNNLIFKASLAVAGEVTRNHNDVIASIGQFGDTASLIGLLREGDDALIPGGLHFKKFTWFHGLQSSAISNTSGVFIGVLLANASGATKGHGCWYSDGFSVTPIVYSGGPVTIDGVTKTVKSVSKPTVSAPAQAEGRVGNPKTISLLIKTVDGVTAIKTFDAPPFVITLAAKVAKAAPSAKVRYGKGR
jgi:hypothetical protein